MGNKLRSQKKHARSKLFFVPENSIASTSLTIPSVCTSPSFHLSAKKSVSTTSSEAFNWSQMQHLYLQQEFLTVEHLTLPIMKVTATVLEVLKRQLGDICGDVQAGVLKMPDPIIDKIGSYTGGKNANPNQASTTSTTAAVTKKTIVHFVTALYVHDMILNYFRLKKIDLALDLIKQVAVFHALLGVTATDFRMMDWFIIHYLIKNKITSDESINNLMIYLNIVSNYTAKFYRSQSVRHSMIQTLTTEKKDDRNNKARENFRLMKKWKKQVENFKGQEHYVEQLLAEQMLLRRTEEDLTSIDTLTLKENDCIMKHFVRKRRNEDNVNTEYEDKSGA